MIQYFVSLTRIPSIALLVQVSMQQKLCLETAVKITSCVHTGRWPVGPGQRLTKCHFIPAAGTAAKTTSACAMRTSGRLPRGGALLLRARGSSRWRTARLCSVLFHYCLLPIVLLTVLLVKKAITSFSTQPELHS